MPIGNIAGGINRDIICNTDQMIGISVNESGTEVTAVTDIIADTLGDPVEISDFVADRPFIFIIEEQSTGTILYMGRVNQL